MRVRIREYQRASLLSRDSLCICSENSALRSSCPAFVDHSSFAFAFAKDESVQSLFETVTRHSIALAQETCYAKRPGLVLLTCLLLSCEECFQSKSLCTENGLFLQNLFRPFREKKVSK
uniref:hypothetical protein n=1 Tax=Jatropha curcas TaxID=180498 RepID=UPI00279E8D65|nr:hypothetical protein QLP06_mgp105 [Jatropha curcas]WFG81134.1 hypothetical protein [Jatropha curcas]